MLIYHQSTGITTPKLKEAIIFKPSLNHLEGVAAFPKFETIMNLADFFNVDVGYLIGETDMQSYSMEKVCNFTGLSDNAITTILNIGIMFIIYWSII